MQISLRFCFSFVFVFIFTFVLASYEHAHTPNRSTLTHPHIPWRMYSYRKKLYSTLQPKKHLICVLFYRPNSNTTRKWVKAKRKLSVRQKGKGGPQEKI